MNQSIAVLGKRLQSIEAEIEVSNRRRKSEASTAAKALAGISTEDAEMLKAIAPNIVNVVTFTEEQIYTNANGEVQQIKQVVDALRSYLEERLDYFEERINEP